MSKYYTPSVEEFHIGFEFEAYESVLATTTKKWQTFTLGLGLGKQWNIIEDSICKEEIRVKYLDKEDIESLGFKSYNFPNWFRKKIDKEHPGYIYITPTNFHGNNSWWIETDTIILNTDKSFSHNGQRRSIFNGKIKNKSELKVLLKQLGIDE